MCPSAPTVCSELGGQKPVLSLSLDRIILNTIFLWLRIDYLIVFRSVFNCVDDIFVFTYWGRVTHIYIGKLSIIGSDNDLSPGRRQSIIWTNAGMLLIETNLDSNRGFFRPRDLKIWWMTSSTLHQALCIISNPSVNSNWSYCPKTLNSGQNRQFFVPCDLVIWRMALKNNRAPLICCIKLYASFHSHWWIQTKVTVRKRSIRVKFGDFLSRVTLKFEGWPRKTIGHLFYATSLKLYASFRSHWWIQTGVIVRKRPIWVKIDDWFFSCVILKFDGWLWKTTEHLS